MKSERAYDLGSKYNSFHKTIRGEDFWIPNGNFVLTTRLKKAEDGLNVAHRDSEGNPRTYSNTVALIIGLNDVGETPYLVIPNDSEKDTPQMKFERQRLRDLVDSLELE